MTCKKCSSEYERGKQEGRDEENRRTLYQLSSLDTMELKEKAPVCWLKLRQVIEKLQQGKRELE